MQIIIDFFRDTVIMRWLFGETILELFNEYFISQSPSNQVLIIMGVTALTIIGGLGLVKSILKMTMLWIKVALLVGLAYYLFVVVLGIDVWAFLS
jgi:hypothetical protein